MIFTFSFCRLTKYYGTEGPEGVGSLCIPLPNSGAILFRIASAMTKHPLKHYFQEFCVLLRSFVRRIKYSIPSSSWGKWSYRGLLVFRELVLVFVKAYEINHSWTRWIRTVNENDWSLKNSDDMNINIFFPNFFHIY